MKNIQTEFPRTLVTSDEFKIFEAQLGEKLPSDYRKYLQKYNGADVIKANFGVSRVSGYFWIDYMHYLDNNLFAPSEEANYQSISFNHFKNGEYVPRDCLIIATVCDQHQLLLRYKGNRKGEIWVKVNESSAPYGASEEYCKYREKSTRKLAGSFTEFMQILSEYEHDEEDDF